MLAIGIISIIYGLLLGVLIWKARDEHDEYVKECLRQGKVL